MTAKEKGKRVMTKDDEKLTEQDFIPVKLSEGRITESEMMPDKLCPNCGCYSTADALECCECGWEFGFST